APIVAVGELEAVDVPLGRIELAADQLPGYFVGGANPRAAAFAGVVEGLLVHLAGHGIVDDVADLDAVVLAGEPSVEPESFRANELFLVVRHRAGNIHHVDNGGVGFGLIDGAPRAVALVVGDGDDERLAGIVRAGRDLTAEGLEVRAFAVAEGFGAGPANAV